LSKEISQPKTPNILLIVADDLGYGDVGLYGSVDALTPSIDTIGQNGLHFRQFYAESPACTPTRFSLFTGLHINHAHKHLTVPPYLFYPLRPGDTELGIPSVLPTLATALKSSGYSTALFGKWHLGHGAMLGNEGDLAAANDSIFHPNYHGFDEFYGTLFGVIDYNTHYTGPPYKRQLDWFENKTLVPQEEGQYATHLLTERAKQYLRSDRQPDRPFFLCLAYTAPHWGFPKRTLNDSTLLPLARTQLPLDEKVEALYLDRFHFLETQPSGLSPTQREVRKRYLAMVAILDDGIGEVLATLKQQDLERDTILIVLSDNGGDLVFGGSNIPFRGQKFEMYEGGIRVPALIQWPNYIAPGQASEQIAQVVDLLPTLLSLAGATAHQPAELDGLDLSHHLLTGELIDRDLWLSNPFFGQVYRQGSWKYLTNHLSGGAPELYHLGIDSGEQQNIAWYYSQQVKNLMDCHEQVRQQKQFNEAEDPLLPPMVQDYLTTILKEKGFPP
jgi:arylsulfatase A-like enzyme